jgi:hypothetical protein
VFLIKNPNLFLEQLSLSAATTNEFTHHSILDDMINSHPRYLTLVSYICGRAGKKIEIKYPLYKDTNTGVGKIDGNITPDEIYMDHADFGIG